jgi:hypothetical protein
MSAVRLFKNQGKALIRCGAARTIVIEIYTGNPLCIQGVVLKGMPV